ncbi:hypothetical protein LTR56_028058 [Elasticomyces elasticus]|nr:hypothetical protein LTR56_028058 [Elasticomyces elasticus]
MELVKALSRSAGVSDHARGKDRGSTPQAFAPPSTQQEAQKMQEAINLYRQGQENTALYDVINPGAQTVFSAGDLRG